MNESNVAVTIREAKEHIITAMYAGLTTMLTGSPGLGKSDLIRQIAEQERLEVVDLRLAQLEPVDLNGLPCEKNGKFTYLPMACIPIEGDPLPEGKIGWLLFLDEFNHSDRSVQKAAYKLILDRMIGEYKLHKNVVIVAAGNLVTDNAFVEEMGTAMQSRMIHLELLVSIKDWLEWAKENAIDHRVVSYINYAPQHLLSFEPEHNDKTFACPRTWEFTSRLIKNKPELTFKDIPLLSGAISEAIGREFFGFSKIYKDLVTFEQVIANPHTVPVPTDPATLFALTGVLTNKVDATTVVQVMEYVKRMPAEFQIVTIRKMDFYPAIQDWITEMKVDFF